MPFRITFNFHSGVQGWKEVWYASPPAIGLEAYIPYVEAMGERRLQLLAKGAFLSHMTIHDEAVRQSGITSTVWSGTPSPLTAALTRDVSNAAWVSIAADSTDTYHRKYFLRGLPDDWVKWLNNKPENVAAFIGAFGLWRDAIIDDNANHVVVPGIPRHKWQMKAINKDATPGIPFAKPVIDVKPDTITGLTMITVSNHAFPPGKPIRIRHCGFEGPKPPKVNGRWLMIPWPLGAPVSTNVFLIDHPAGDVGDYVLTRNGDARVETPAYVDVATLTLDRPGSHKTGKARLTVRGARTRRF